MSVGAVSTTVISPYNAIQLPSFPSSLVPLAQDLSVLAREHSRIPSQKIPVVGIGGCPGVGKTTITNMLTQQLKKEGFSCVVIRFDDWTNPQGARQNGYFNLKGVHDFFKAFLEGLPRIEKPIDNEFTDEQGREVVDLTGVDLILFEGLLALSGKEPGMNYSQYCDRGVFIEANEADITRWKRDRPTNVQRTDDEFAQHMKAVFDYHRENIEPFKSNAAWIVRKDTDHSYNLEVLTRGASV